jgi:putative FmdB family regulatory protein
MPTYTYMCDGECRERRDVWHEMSNVPTVICTACGGKMRKDVGASFPHVSLKWHKDQGIGEKLVLQSTRRRTGNGVTGGIAQPG